MRIKAWGTMERVFAGGLAILVVLSSGLYLTLGPQIAAPIAPANVSGSMLIWEAYSRGLISISQVDVTYTYRGQQFTEPIGFQVISTSTEKVEISENVMLLSPNPAGAEPPTTTQDGIMTDGMIDPGSSLTYGYGDFVAQGILNMPPWWCTEERQFVQANVPVSLGGEIAPFGLNPILDNIQGGPGGTQDSVWAYLRENPSPVIGKRVNGAFWGEVPETAGQALQVVLHATNLAISDENDGLPEPDAPNARAWDRIPAGYELDLASPTPGYSLDLNPDGSTTISWVTDLPAADVTNKAPDDQPTPYVTREFSYVMTTPHIPPSRVGLPRASVSVEDDETPEAASEQPLLDVFRVPLPPIADAGPGYLAVEGAPVVFNAGASSDPNGDPLQFRWDFSSDGAWDTPWSVDPTAVHTFGDDFSGRVRVEVSDGESTTTAEATVTITNVAPTVSVSVSFAPLCSDDDDDDDRDDNETRDDDDDDDDDDRDDNETRDDDDDDDRDGNETRDDDDDDDDRDGNETRDDDDDDDDRDDDECGDDDDDDSRAMVVLTAVATDPGSDDLTFTWSGDCIGLTGSNSYPNDPSVVPDPDPSADLNPRSVTDVQRGVCQSHHGGDDDDDDDDDEGERERRESSFAWQLIVEDDDGGITILSGTVTLPGRHDEDERDDHDDDGDDEDGCHDGDGGDHGDDDDDDDDDDDGGDDDGGDDDDDDGDSIIPPDIRARNSTGGF